MKHLKIALTALIGLSLATGLSSAYAAGKAKHPKDIQWSFEGPFGKYDKQAAQRGLQVYQEVCASCHGLNQVSFRNLFEPSGPLSVGKHCPEEYGAPAGTDCSNPNDNPVSKWFAKQYTIVDGPDDEGDMFERPGLPADKFPSRYANDKAAAANNGGAVPPDFSLIVKARHDGANYIYSLLVGYDEVQKDYYNIPAGNYLNPYFPGDVTAYIKPEYMHVHDDGYAHFVGKDKEGLEGEALEKLEKKEKYIQYGGALKMAPPLADGMVDYKIEDLEDPYYVEETVEQYAHDVVMFLAWASEPKMEQRKEMGLFTMIYLIFLSIVLYASYKQIWRNVEH